MNSSLGLGLTTVWTRWFSSSPSDTDEDHEDEYCLFGDPAPHHPRRLAAPERSNTEMADTEGIEMVMLPPVRYSSDWGTLTPRALKPGHHSAKTQVDNAETYNRVTHDFTNIVKLCPNPEGTRPAEIKIFKPFDNPVLGKHNAVHTWFRQASVSVTFSGFHLKSGRQVLGGILTIPSRAASKRCGECVNCYNRAKISNYSTLPMDQRDCDDDNDDNFDRNRFHLVLHVDPDNTAQGTNTSKPVSSVKRIERMVRIPGFRDFATSQSTRHHMTRATGRWTLEDCEADDKGRLWKSSGVEMTVHFDHLVFGKLVSTAKDAWIALKGKGLRVGSRARADGLAEVSCRVEGLVPLKPDTDAAASSSGATA